MKEIDKNNKSFEDIKHMDEYGVEFWYVRELQSVLDYKEWRKFEGIIKKAEISCKNSGINSFDHFVGIDKMVQIGSGAERKQQDYKLSRYACYLIAQKGDSRKKVIALAQTYFAVQTRKQEITEKEYSMLTEDEKRFYQRNLTRKGNYSLNQAAKNAGVKNFDKFHNAGYKGLYNGETADDIAKRKGLRYREDILDNMGSEELAANLFRITQTESRLKKDNIQGEKQANKTHYKIGIVFQNPENQIIFNNIYDELSFSLKGLEKEEIEKRIENSLQQVGMIEYKNYDLYSLSLGQKQRIMIAEVLAKNPKYIIFDEPTTMIDSQGKEMIYKIIANLKKEGYTIICITNLADEILIADRTLILENGKIAHEIKKEDLINKSHLLKESGIKEPILIEIINKLRENGIILDIKNFTVNELICRLKGILKDEKCN